MGHMTKLFLTNTAKNMLPPIPFFTNPYERKNYFIAILAILTGYKCCKFTDYQHFIDKKYKLPVFQKQQF